MNQNASTVLDEVREMTYQRLANMVADIAGPDAEDSPGAGYLKHVRDAVVEALEWKVEKHDDPDLAHAALVLKDDSHELADGAVPVYTWQRWQVFVDLGAWQIDVSEFVGGGEDMTTLAGIALYEVARLLTDELCEYVEDAWYELDNQDDAEDEELDDDSGA